MRFLGRRSERQQSAVTPVVDVKQMQAKEREQLTERFETCVIAASKLYWHCPTNERSIASALRAARQYEKLNDLDHDDPLFIHAKANQGLLYHEAYILARNAAAPELTAKYLTRARNALEIGKAATDPTARGWATYILAWTYLQMNQPTHAQELLGDIFEAAELWEVPPARLRKLQEAVRRAIPRSENESGGGHVKTETPPTKHLPALA